MSGRTKILAVVHKDGTTAHVDKVWGGPNAILFEVVEGSHQGKRGPDAELHDLVGPIVWGRSEVVLYETGERLPAEVNREIHG